MSLNIDQIAEAFCSHRFAETYPYMADEIKWNIIGREELMGREAVINKCAEGAKFLETVSTTYPKLKIYCAETCVIVEGAAQFQDKDNRASSVASCDVFQFLDGDWLRLLHMSLTIHNHRLSSFHQNDTPPPRCLFVQAVL